MTATLQHDHHGVKHTHGPGCGHEATIHLDHVDYSHAGTWEHEHQGHYDTCSGCDCGACAGQCVVCDTAGCSCPTCVHTKCQCSHCTDSCATCVCDDCNCTTCTHAA